MSDRIWPAPRMSKDPSHLVRVAGYDIGEHPDLGDKSNTLIKVGGAWYDTGEVDVPSVERVILLATKIVAQNFELYCQDCFE